MVFVHKENGKTVYLSQVLNLSADAANVNLPENLVGGYLYAVEIKSTADDAVTFTIKSHLGTTLYTVTTSAASSGAIGLPVAFYPMNKNGNVYPTYTLSGLGSGTVSIEITVVKI
jgi:hypothetical protein